MRLAACLLAFAVAAPATAEDLHPVAADIKKKLKNPEKPFALIIALQVKDGQAEKLEAAFAEARKETRKEKGNEVYDMVRSADNPSVYYLYERYSSVDAIQHHLKQPYTVKLLQQFDQMLAGKPELKVAVPASPTD